MARTSQVNGGEAARGQQPKASVKRAAARPKATRIAAATRAGPPPPAEAEPLATAQPDLLAAAPERPESPPTPEAKSAAGNEAGDLPPAAPEPVAEHSEPVVESAAEIAADAARVAATVAERQPAPVLQVSPRHPLGTAGGVPDPAAMLGASRSLVEGTLRAHGQMIGFTCRQAEHGLAVGRVMLTSGSLPAALALQARYVGQAFDDALAQTLELSRLSTDLMRASLRSLGRR